MSAPPPSAAQSNGPTSKPFSLALSSKSSKKQRPNFSTPSAQSNLRSNSATPRPSFLGHDLDDSDTEPEEPTHEEVTGFDQSGAIRKHAREKKEDQPLVIKVDKRNGWRERLLGSARAKKSWLPEEVRAQREAEKTGQDVDGGVEVQAPSTKFGLTYASEAKTGEQNGDTNTVKVDAETTEQVQMEIDSGTVVEKDLSQDEIALQALVRESKGEVEQRSNLVIQSQTKADEGYDETRSFRDDVAHRPDSASLADYAAVPVEQFGAALLRGMGWKEGQPVGRTKYTSAESSQQQDSSLTPRIPERRAGYLGIGAKDLSGKAGAAEAELGAWGKAAMRKGKQGEGLYTPVLMKSKKTGEMITEEEFKKLAKEQAVEKEKREKEDEWKERRDKNLSKSGRRYNDNDDYRSSRDSSARGSDRRRPSSADRDRSRDRDSTRRRRDDYYDDRGKDDHGSERKDRRHYRDRDYRDDSRKERDRDPRRDRDRDRDTDKEKSSNREYRDRDRHKERGERCRDSERDRRADYR